MIRTRTLMVPFALCAVGISLAFLSGCRKKEPAVVPPPKPAQPTPAMSSVDERMADTNYVKKLDAQYEEMKVLAKRLHTATNDAERKAAAQLLEVNRLKTAEIVRARMAYSNKEISK